MEYLIEYGMFLAKAATIVVAIVIVVGTIAAAGSKQKKAGKKGFLKVTRLNDHLDEMRDAMRETVLDKDHLKLAHKEEKKQAKADKKDKKAKLKQEQKQKEVDGAEDNRKPRVYVLNFKGNIAADAVASLREEITAVISMAENSDEVILRLESPGGMVHAYGLASSQLLRIKNAKIPLTICVDKVAASGGYMMACLADKLVAAPFAIIGSIGVLVQLPNFHKVLKKHDVDYEQISAGEYKRTLSVFGEITQKGRDKVQEDVENIHDIFKSWVKDHRPSIEIDKISTGETWVAMQAKERYMVDEIKTSDECLVAACNDAEVFEVEYEFKKSIQDKLGRVLEESSFKVLSRWFDRPTDDIYQ
ncbi:MAG: protease SohB [Gammaproteobacteria bacterium]|nr:protease SohB [Gammaproteobacteria bacterium]